MKFWDSCAIIPLCIEEPFSESIRTTAEKDDDFVVWWGTSVECCSAFARYRRTGKISVEEERSLRELMVILADSWNEITPSEESRNLANRLLLRHPLRAADSLQLAAAIIWSGNNPDGMEFVCLDKRLREAAHAEGFIVLPPDKLFEALALQNL